MRVLKVKLSYPENLDERLAIDLMYDFDPMMKLFDRKENPSIKEIHSLINKVYNFYLEQVQKWQEMIVGSSDFVFEIVSPNFGADNIKEIVKDGDKFRIFFWDDIEFDHTLKEYFKSEEMFWNMYESYFDSWERELDGYKFYADSYTIRDLYDEIIINFIE